MRKLVFALLILGVVGGALSSYATTRMVLGEMFTNWGCSPCKPANDELDRFAPLHPNLAVIRYHTWWPRNDDPFYLQNIPENAARTNYYGVNAVPRFHIDGIINGGSNWPSYEALVSGRETVESPLAIRLHGTYDAVTKSGSLYAYVEATDAIGLVNLMLHFVITESNIFLPAPNGQTVFHEAMRDMLPDAFGELVFLSSPGDTVIRYRDFKLGPSWVENNCEMVVFVQSNLGTEVLQAAKWKMPGTEHDVSTDSVTSPPDTVMPDSLFTPTAWVSNYGDFSEVFGVECIVNPGGYADTMQVMVAPDDGIECVFKQWTVPPDDSTAYTVCVRTILVSDTIPSNDSLCKEIYALRPGLLHDAGVDSITSPPDTVMPDSLYVPAAWVHNYGDVSEGFGVECLITPGAYADTFTVMGLAPGSDIECVFDQWTVPPDDSTTYTMCVRTLLGTDVNPANDSSCKDIYAESPAIHDLGVDSLTSPPDTVIPDTLYSPRAWVHNYGDFSEIFGVECFINPGGYGDTFVVMNLDPGSDVECVFDQWIVPPDDSTMYTMCVNALLGTDANPSNDTLCKDIYAEIPAMHDAGVDSITSPPDTVEIGMGYDPAAWVKNYGNRTETFSVVCAIDSSGQVVYGDTSTVDNLAPGSEYEVLFSTWTVPPSAGVTYNTCVWTLVMDDVVPANDTLCKSSYSFTGVAEGFFTRKPSQLFLYQNRPNPFSISATISYEVPVSGKVNISIYDAAGSLVKTLVDAETIPGFHAANWDGKNAEGDRVSDGVYFCKLSMGRGERTTKMVLVR